MKRLLCITAGMNTGGAETFLMKIYRELDKTKYQMDFCVAEKNNYYAEEIREMGGKIYYIPVKSKHPIASFNAIKKIVKKNNYHLVMRVNEHSLSTIDLLAAKFGGAHTLVMRSSNASSPSKLSRRLHKIFLFLPKRIPNIKIAPSTEAAEYTFGKNSVKNGSVQLLHNAIDVEYFKYSPKGRKKIREEFSLQDRYVVGHVGRFSLQKNHEFLLDIFKEITKIRNDAILLLVGQGENEQAIKEKAKRLNITEKIVFAGVRKDIPELLSAMDIFVFPSLYEGMPNTVIEAQANGLKCVISDSITREANITGNVQYLSLEESAKAWAEDIVQTEITRTDQSKELKEHEYDIESVVDKFVNLVYLEG